VNKNIEKGNYETNTKGKSEEQGAKGSFDGHIACSETEPDNNTKTPTRSGER
jgi:hypothetical protein